jgi:hypothetical protein
MLAHNLLLVNGKTSAEGCDEPLIPAALVDIHHDMASLR